MQRASGSVEASEVEWRRIPTGSSARYRLRNRTLGLRESAPPVIARGHALCRLGPALFAATLRFRNARESGAAYGLESLQADSATHPATAHDRKGRSGRDPKTR